MRPPIAISAALVTAVTAALALDAMTRAAAAPVLSTKAAVKAAVGRPVVNVRCWTGWGWSSAGLSGALRPGILAVGSHYNSMAYGYSGYPQYYGEGYPPYYSCDPAYVYAPADRYVRHRRDHTAIGLAAKKVLGR
jgi:hypothetical protein